jgi:acyl transferase domain-containing protein
MSEIDQRIARLSPEQRALLERRLGGAAGAPAAATRGREAIAIVGAACRFPGEASDLDSFWRLLRSGIDGVVRVPSERWDADALFDEDPMAAGKISSRWGGFISNVDRFDADFFGISPREAIEMDPQQRILLEVAFDALDHAGMTREALAGGKMGVFVGVHGHASDYLLLQN